MRLKWSFWGCAAQVAQVVCAATVVVAIVGFGAQVSHPVVMKPVAVSRIVLVDDEDDWTQQQEQDQLQQQLDEQEMLQSEQETQQAEQQAEEQNELAQQQAQQAEQQGLLTEQEAQLDVPGS